MSTPRTKSIITIVALLVVLAVLSAVSAAPMLMGFGRARGNFNGTFNGTPVPRGNAQGGGNFQGGNGGRNGGDGAGGGFQGGGGGFQGGGGGFRGGGGFGGGGGFNLFGVTRTLGISPVVIFYVNIAAAILGILLALLCAYGVWKQKKWALNLSMLLAVLFLLAALPGLFSLGGRGGFNLLRTAIPILSACASAVIIFLGILPSVRETVS